MKAKERGYAMAFYAVFLVAVVVPAGDAEVEGVVDQRLALGTLMPVIDSFAERLLGVGDREIHQGRHSTARPGPGAAAVVVRRHSAAERHIEVHMHVDDPRQHEVTGRVDDRSAV